jgi:hypothetical protein
MTRKKNRPEDEDDDEDLRAASQEEGTPASGPGFDSGPENPPTGAGLDNPDAIDDVNEARANSPTPDNGGGGASPSDPSAQASAGDDSADQSAPSQAELDADREPLKPEEAEQLLRAGHRLRIKGDDPANWVTISRHAGDLVVSFAATAERIKDITSQPLLLAE